MIKVYGVIDRKGKQIVNVFVSPSDEAAERSFLMLLTGPRNIFTDFPEDFDLVPVAELSLDGGLIVAAHGSENLVANGFTVNSFRVSDVVKSGADYDKRYLAMVSADRLAAYASNSPADNEVDQGGHD